MPRIFPVSDLFDRGKEPIRFEANAAEKTAISRAFELEGLTFLRAVLHTRMVGKILHVSGQVSARVTQTCVVSLELFEHDIDEAVDVRFSDDLAAIKDAATDIPGNEADWVDPPDPIEGDTLDLGALVLEHLALGIDPYPRKPGVAFDLQADDGGETDKSSPFEALRRLSGQGENS